MLIPLVIALHSASTSALSICHRGIPIREVQSFLDVHNYLRQSISAGNFTAKSKLMPPSRDPIPNLVWNCELEQRAQTHANRCKYEHSQNIDDVGENVYMRWSSVKITIRGQANDASSSWANEFQRYGWPDIHFTLEVFNSGIGHATQMAWQETTKIGCGIALCNEETSTLVVCQYAEAGNYHDDYIYIPQY